jgi:hypothetical protein
MMIDPTRFAGTDTDVYGLLDSQRAIHVEAKSAKRIVTDQHPLPKHEQGERFVRGPIPYDWLRVALSFGGKAGNLVFAIWWLAGIERGSPIRLTKQVLSDFKISTRTSRRLLVDFERAGLVSVDRHRGRGPLVTLLSLRCSRKG